MPASWEICMQVKKQQWLLDMEQQTGSKPGKLSNGGYPGLEDRKWRAVFLYLFICNWLMIALQHWFDSCHTATWINHSSTYVPSLLHPSRLLHRLSLSSLSQRANFHWLSVYIWQCICFHATLSIHLTLSFVFPALFHKFVLSVAALWIGSSVPSFLIP